MTRVPARQTQRIVLFAAALAGAWLVGGDPLAAATPATPVAATPATPVAATSGTPGAATPVPYIEVTSTCTLSDAINAANTGDGPSQHCPNHAPGTRTIRITANSGTATVPGTTNETDPGIQLDPNNPGTTGSVTGNVTMTQAIKGTVTIEGDPALERVAIYATPLEPRGRTCTVEIIDGVAQETCQTETSARGGRFFEVAPGGSLTLRHLTLAGATIEGRWETIRTSCPTIVNCGFDFATPALGAAIYAEGPLTLDGVTLAGNRAVGGSSATGYPWRGSSAVGGAIHSTSTVTVLKSVFDDNRVQATHSGSALGGAIALSNTATARISDSLFIANAAYGGNGPAGAHGRRGRDGAAGVDGHCDDTNWDLAAGGFGGAGGKGEAGEDGGDGGDAVGVIAGGASVVIDHTSILDSYASAGAAGAAGFGGIGGSGGNGGDGAVCSTIIDTVPGPAVNWNGTPGAGGDAGANGLSGLSGNRGAAVSTVDVDGTLTLSNVTIHGGHAVVPPDDLGRLTPVLYAAQRSGLTRVGFGGSGGFVNVGPGVRAPNGRDGTADSTLVERERAITSGAAVAFASTIADRLSISFSTIADLSSGAPTDRLFRPNATVSALTLGSGVVDVAQGPNVGLSSSVLWNPDLGAEPCPNLGHEGFTNVVRASSACSGLLPAIDASDTRPIAPTRAPFGAPLRPGFHHGDRPYQAALLPLTPGSRAVDRRAASDCTTLDGVTLTDDGRRGPRNDVRCDAGAFELDKNASSPVVTIDGPAGLYRGDAPAPVTIGVPTNQGASTLTVTVLGIDGVVFPAGFTPTAANADPGVSAAAITLAAGQAYPYRAQISLATTAAAGNQVTVAALLTSPGGTTEAPNLDLPVLDDGEIFVAIDASDRWSPCQGYLPITYTASSIGHSPAPGATLTLTPDIVRPTAGNGLTLPAGEPINSTPLVYPSAGTATVNGDGTVRWTIPPMGRDDPHPSLTMYVAIGRLDPTQHLYLPGTTLQAGYSVQYDGGMPRDTPVRVVPTTQVQVANDLDQLDGILGYYSGGPSAPIRIKAGTSWPVWASFDATTCDVPTTKPYRWDPVTVTIRQPDGATPGTPLYGPVTSFVRADGTPGDQWFSFNLLAPKAPGVHYLEFEFVGPGGTPVVKRVPYTVEPVLLTLSDALSAAERSPYRLFDVMLTAPLSQDLTLEWRTRDGGTATPDVDYRGASGTVTIPAGQTGRGFIVNVTDDTVAEENESIWVEMNVAPGTQLPPEVKIARWAAQTGIIDDDVATLSVDDISVTEGSAPPAAAPAPPVNPLTVSATPSATTAATTDATPSTAATFTVRLSTTSDRPTVVHVKTADNTAYGNADFTPVDREVTIPAGETSAQVAVDVVQDATYEATERFTLEATAGGTTAEGSGTIVDDDLTVAVGAGEPGAACTGPLTLSIPGWSDSSGIHLAIDWGEGAAAEALTPTSAEVTLAHTFAAAGMRAVEVTVMDADGQTHTVTGHVPVAYRTNGFLNPLGPNGNRTPIRWGSYVPARIVFTDCDGSTPSGLAPVLTVSLNGKVEMTDSMTFANALWRDRIDTHKLTRGARTHTVTVTIPGNRQVVSVPLRLR